MHKKQLRAFGFILFFLGFTLLTFQQPSVETLPELTQRSATQGVTGTDTGAAIISQGFSGKGWRTATLVLLIGGAALVCLSWFLKVPESQD